MSGCKQIQTASQFCLSVPVTHCFPPPLRLSLCSCWSRRWWSRSSWGGQLTWTWPRTPVTRPWLSTLASLRWNVWQSPTSTCPKNLWPGTSLPTPCCTKVCGPVTENNTAAIVRIFFFLFFFLRHLPKGRWSRRDDPEQMTFTGQNYWHAFFMRHLSARRPSVLCVCVCVRKIRSFMKHSWAMVVQKTLSFTSLKKKRLRRNQTLLWLCSVNTFCPCRFVRCTIRTR